MGSSGPSVSPFEADEEAHEKTLEEDEERKNRLIQQNQIDQLNRMRGGGQGPSPSSGGGNSTLGG